MKLLRLLWQSLLCCLLCGLLTSSAWAGSKEFNFNLPAAATTSAGVYLSDGTLVRTLWSRKTLPAGTNNAVWDGLDDNGQPVAGGNYSVKVLYHNVNYEWQGTIGNNSAAQTGPTVHRGFSIYHDMAISGTSVFLAQAYNEGHAAWSRTTTATPTSLTALGRIDQARPLGYAATDGTNVYYANTGSGWIAAWPSFVAAFKVSDNSEVVFPNGVTDTAAGGGSQTWNSVIDRELGETNAPSGIAVQTSGTYLFVAHGGLNQIRVLNKTSGALVQTVTVTAPGRLATTTDGHLWAICTESGNRVVRRYQVGTGGALTAASVVTGLSDPLAVAVSPDNGTVTIADGGTSQQVKGFANVASGTPTSQWTLGTAGGYNATNGPDVSNTKFHFVEISNDGNGKLSFLAYEPDGSFWVGDPGNQRNLHFSSTRTYINQLSFLGRNYVSTVCSGAPTRLFAQGWLEFTIDYSQPSKPGWVLSKNWTAGLPDNIAKNNPGGLAVVHKLSNNRVYATARNGTTGKNAVLELTATGARQTGIELDTNQTLHEDGSLRSLNYGYNSVVNIRTLSGFDGSGNPLWNAATTLASAPATQLDPKGTSGYRPSGARFPTTSSGKVIVSDGQPSGKNVYHLGAINSGGTKWLWKAAPTGVYFNDKGQVGNGTFPVNNSFVQGQEIVLGCHGEFYTPPSGRTSQANQFMHFWDNGLLIGEFGTDLADLDNPNINFYTGAIAKKAGNSFAPAFVTVGSSKYLWHNDEWGTGVHCWKINNSSSVAELTFSVTLPATGGNGTGLTGQYFDGTDFNTLKLTRLDRQVNFNWGNNSPDAAAGVPVDNFTVRWSGLVQPLFSETYTFYCNADNKSRIWVNGQLLADRWVSGGEGSGTITLTAGQKYSIVMEMLESTVAANATLSWSCPSQAKQIIPYSQLYPSDAIAINCAGPAVGRFQADPFGTTDGHAVSTASAITLTGLNDPAPMSVYQNARMRSSAYNFMNLTPYANYKVRLHLAEFQSGYTAPGQRVFKVGVNRLGFITPNVDIIAEAGGTLKGTIHEFVASANNRGELRISFEETPQWSLVGGIELVRDVSDQATNPQFALVGQGNGLKGQYYSGLNFTPLTLTRIDPEINFDWTGTAPATSVGPNNFSVRWTGKVQAIEGGSYTLMLATDEGARLWLDNVLVIDKWGVGGTHQYIVNLGASTQHDLKVEYQQTTGNSSIRLLWKRPNNLQEVIPLTQYYPAP